MNYRFIKPQVHYSFINSDRLYNLHINIEDDKLLKKYAYHKDAKRGKFDDEEIEFCICQCLIKFYNDRCNLIADEYESKVLHS